MKVFTLTTLYTIALGVKVNKDGIIVKFLSHYFNVRVISFGAAQGLVLLGTLLRLPIISSSTTLSSFGLFILYTAALGLLPVFVAGVINRTRIETLKNSHPVQFSFSNGSIFLGVQILLIVFFLTNFCFFRFTVVGEVIVLSITALFLIRFSPYFGAQQGQGQVAQQNISQSVGAIAGLVLIFYCVKGPYWVLLSGVQQLNLLVAVSCISALIPYVFARVSQRARISKSPYSNATKRKPFSASISELASTLPPAALTFIDTISLQLFANAYQLSLYGISQRLSAVATFMTGANYINEANEVSMAKGLGIKEASKRVMKINLLNAPFLVMFIVLSPFLTRFLSSGKVTVDWFLIIAYLAIAMVQPAWVVVSNLVYIRKDLTRTLGSSILRYVIPTSILSTAAGGLIFGAKGVVFATLISYCLAVILASIVYWRK